MYERHGSPRSLRSALAVVLSVTALAACADQITDPVRVAPDSPSFNDVPPDTMTTTVCKVGPAGDYTFTISRDSATILTTGWSGTPLVTNPFTVAAGDCVDAFKGGSTSDQLWITEIDLPAGLTLDSIVVQKKGPYTCEQYSSFCPVTYVGRYAVLTIANYAEGYFVTFYNSAEEQPSLRVEKTADAASVGAGNPIGFSLSVYSDGPATATSVTLADTLPTGTGISWYIESATPTCALTGNILNCSFGDMAAGTSASVHLVSQTTTESCGIYNNTAHVEATNHGRVSDSASTEVLCAPTTIEGCTPGFWKAKQHHQYWTGYTTDQLIGTVFANAGLYSTDGKTLAEHTLLEGLSLQGSETLSGAAEILLRAGVAALLNAASPAVSYTYSEADVISSVSAALGSQDRDAMIGYAATLDDANNQECTAKD